MAFKHPKPSASAVMDVHFTCSLVMTISDFMHRLLTICFDDQMTDVVSQDIMAFE